MTPTPFQTQCMEIIDQLNAAEFAGWFRRSSCMATCQVESAFRTRATRFEPSINEASYGLGQVLESTARSLGMTGPPDQLFEPEIGIRYMMRVHRRDWDVLRQRFGRDPTLDEWTDAYNRGCHGGHLGEADHAYVQLWEAARALWLVFDQGQPVAPSPSLPPHTQPPAPPEGTGDAEAEALNEAELKTL